MRSSLNLHPWIQTSACTGIILLLLLSISCTQDPDIGPADPNTPADTTGTTDTTGTNNGQQVTAFDTIAPLCYFPAYPGSYWVYSSGDTMKVDPDYQMHIFDVAEWPAPDPVWDTLALPMLIQNGILTAGYEEIFVNGYTMTGMPRISYRDPHFMKFLSETEYLIFPITEFAQGSQILGKTITKDSTVAVGSQSFDSVLVVIQFNYMCGGSQESCANQRDYFAKGVGLIKRENRQNANTPWITELELNSYYINN